MQLYFSTIASIVVEISLITPPVSLDVCNINTLAHDVPAIKTFKGVVPFILSYTVSAASLIASPWFALVVPKLLATD